MFPTETDSRFLLLLIAVFGASSTIFSMIYNALPGTWEALQAAELRCRTLQAEAGARGAAEVGNLFAQCMAPEDQSRAIWVIGGMLLLFAVAALITAAIPRFLLWRHRLQPLADRPEGIYAELTALCEEAQIEPPPAFVQHRFFRGARVFGRRGCYTVALGHTLADSFATNPRAFRAIMRHELAHLRNGDVEKTYFTLALCAAFGLICLLPLVVLLIDNPLDLSLQLAWRALALGGLVSLAGASVLRAREYYADLRASVWDGAGGALREVLEQQLERTPSRVWSLLHLHPTPADRRLALDRPEQLFEPKLWEIFGVGVASTIALTEIGLLLVDPLVIVPMLQWGWATLLLGPTSAILVALPLFGVVGVPIWRVTFARLAGWQVRRRIPGTAFALGMGMFFGLKLSFFGALFAQFEQPAAWPGLAAFDLIWCGLLVTCLALMLNWTATSASAWLPVTLARRNPHPVPWAARIIGSTLLISIAGIFSIAYLMLRLLMLMYNTFVALAPQYGETLPDQPLIGVLLVVVGILLMIILSPLTTISLMLLAWYPLAASWRNRATTAPAWALLEPTGGRIHMERAALRVGLALKYGTVGGLILMALAIFAIVFTPTSFDDFAAQSAPLVVGFLIIAIIVQSIVALFTARRAPCYQLTHGLGASAVAALIPTLGLITLFWLQDILTVELSLATAGLIFNVGGMATLAVLGTWRLAVQIARRTVAVAFGPFQHIAIRRGPPV